MNAIKRARKIVMADPNSPAARTLVQLVLALESETVFPLSELYALDLKIFDIAIAMLSEWRLDRYYARKGKLLDVSYQAQTMLAH
jgi:hypothetical protein